MSGKRAISTTSRREQSLSFFLFLQGKAPKEIHAIVPETLACFLPGRAKDLSAGLYSPTLSLTSALDGGVWLTRRPGRFAPRKDPVPIVQEAGWSLGPVWTGAENLASHRDSISGPSSP